MVNKLAFYSVDGRFDRWDDSTGTIRQVTGTNFSLGITCNSRLHDSLPIQNQSSIRLARVWVFPKYETFSIHFLFKGQSLIDVLICTLFQIYDFSINDTSFSQFKQIIAFLFTTYTSLETAQHLDTGLMMINKEIENHRDWLNYWMIHGNTFQYFISMMKVLRKYYAI